MIFFMEKGYIHESMQYELFTKVIAILKSNHLKKKNLGF